MFDSDNPVVYEQVYQDLTARLKEAVFGEAAGDLGGRAVEGGVEFDFFGRRVRVDARGVTGPGGRELPVAVRIVACYYVLTAAAEQNGGRPTDELPGDAAFVFQALPRVPVAVTFYDKDEELPAEARVFFDAGVTRFLDLECIAVVGWLTTLLLTGQMEF